MITVSRATGADAATVADIYLRSRAGAGDALPPGVHPPEDVRRHVAEVVVAQQQAYLARDGDDPVAVLVLHDGQVGPDDPSPITDLSWLWVLPHHQGRGIGSRLVEHAKQLAPDGLALWVFTSNLPARKFYAGHGFREIGGSDGSANEENAPDIRCLWRPVRSAAR